MKAVLIVFLSFHYDAGVFGQTVFFDSMALCEVARVKLERENLRPDGWGRPRLIAVCAESKQ